MKLFGKGRTPALSEAANADEIRGIIVHECCEHNDGSGSIRFRNLRSLLSGLTSGQLAVPLATSDLASIAKLLKLIHRITERAVWEKAEPGPGLQELRLAAIDATRSLVSAGIDAVNLAEIVASICCQYESGSGRVDADRARLLFGGLQADRLADSLAASSIRDLNQLHLVLNHIAVSVAEADRKDLDVILQAVVSASSPALSRIRESVAAAPDADGIHQHLATACWEYDGYSALHYSSSKSPFPWAMWTVLDGFNPENMRDALSKSSLSSLSQLYGLLRACKAGMDEACSGLDAFRLAVLAAARANLGRARHAGELVGLVHIVCHEHECTGKFYPDDARLLFKDLIPEPLAPALAASADRDLIRLARQLQRTAAKLGKSPEPGLESLTRVVVGAAHAHVQANRLLLPLTRNLDELQQQITSVCSYHDDGSGDVYVEAVQTLFAGCDLPGITAIVKPVPSEARERFGRILDRIAEKVDAATCPELDLLRTYLAGLGLPAQFPQRPYSPPFIDAPEPVPETLTREANLSKTVGLEVEQSKMVEREADLLAQFDSLQAELQAKEAENLPRDFERLQRLRSGQDAGLEYMMGGLVDHIALGKIVDKLRAVVADLERLGTPRALRRVEEHRTGKGNAPASVVVQDGSVSSPQGATSTQKPIAEPLTEADRLKGLILASCPQCDQAGKVPRRAAGKSAKCKKCGTAFTILFPTESVADLTPLMIAARDRNRAEVARLLKAGANPNQKLTITDHWTALPFAIREMNTEIVQLLIEHGESLEEPDKFGNTPLMKAALHGCREIAEFLIDRGARIDARNNDAMTPFIVAAMWGRADIAKLLLDRGANKDVKDSSGKTALSYAREHRAQAVIDLLTASGERHPTESLPKVSAVERCNQAYALQPDQNKEGNWERAAALYAEAVALARTSRDLVTESLSLHQQGWCLELDNNSAGDWDRASSFYAQAARVRGKAADLAGQARTLRCQVRCVRADRGASGPKTNWGEAVELYGALGGLYSQLGDTANLAYSLFSLGECLKPEMNPAGSWPRAAQFYAAAAEYYGRANMPADRAACLHKQGWCLDPENNPAGNWSACAAAYAEAARLRLEIGDWTKAAQSLFNQGVAMRRDKNPNGDWNVAAQLFSRAAESYGRANLLAERATSGHMHGWCLDPENNPAGNWSACAAAYAEAAHLRLEIGDLAGAGQSLFNQGVAMRRDKNPDGDWNVAAQLFSRTAELREQAGDKLGLVTALDNQALCLMPTYSPTGDWLAASEVYARMALLQEGLPVSQGRALHQQAFCLMHGGSQPLDDATRALFQRAALLKRQGGNEESAKASESWLS